MLSWHFAPSTTRLWGTMLRYPHSLPILKEFAQHIGHTAPSIILMLQPTLLLNDIFCTGVGWGPTNQECPHFSQKREVTRLIQGIEHGSYLPSFLPKKMMGLEYDERQNICSSLDPDHSCWEHCWASLLRTQLLLLTPTKQGMWLVSTTNLLHY
jgi:hypothetical protein